MASKILTPTLRAFRQSATTAPFRSTRSFKSSAILRDSAVAPVTIAKPVGAFRGGLFGFLLGATSAGAGTWFYVMEEYRVSNELLTEDIYASDPIVQKYERFAI